MMGEGLKSNSTLTTLDLRGDEKEENKQNQQSRYEEDEGENELIKKMK